MLALVHAPPPNLAAGVRTHVARQPIDLGRALVQHIFYSRALTDCGARVRVLNVNISEPDGAFLEDTAIVLDELAILCSMGTEARRAEPARLEPILREYRRVERVELPATIEGGDVLRIGRRLLVGSSSRTNAAGIAALADLVGPFGYEVTSVPVTGCLHLKTACTALPDGRLLVNPAWIDRTAMNGHDLIEVPPNEPWAANTLTIGQRVILPAAHPQSAEVIRSLGFEPVPVDLSEFAKAEAGVTCLSLLI